MPRSANQKLKILYILELLRRSSDENHPVSMRQILDRLESLGVPAERKSVYDDIEALRLFGLDIEKTGGNNAGYYLASREFELPELKLLVDAVQSSRFITSKKTLSLIKKLECLCSEHEARSLRRQVFIANRIKSMNESIYYNVDKIHNGISLDRQIAFKYFEYSVSKERVARRGGIEYVVSPIALTWDDKNYYLIAYDGEAGMVKHYRVDKMTGIRTISEKRRPEAELHSRDVADYSNKVFGMFTGEETAVRVRFHNHLADAVIDRFGTDIRMIPISDAEFEATVSVAVSPQFLAWIYGFGADAVIVSPPEVAAKMKKQLAETAALYK